MQLLQVILIERQWRCSAQRRPLRTRKGHIPGKLLFQVNTHEVVRLRPDTYLCMAAQTQPDGNLFEQLVADLSIILFLASGVQATVRDRLSL